MNKREILKNLNFKQSASFIKPDIISALHKEGIELKQRGKHFWSLCPLHSENTPSFKVNPERQTFHCFGCNRGGDVITFVQKLKGYSFKDACRYLGISNNGKPPPINHREIKKREVIKKFKHWCEEYYDLLCIFYRTWNDVKAEIKTIEDAERYAEFYNEELKAQHHMDILCSADNEAKYELFREVTIHAN